MREEANKSADRESRKLSSDLKMEIETGESNRILKQLEVYLDKHKLRDIEEFMDDEVYNEIESDIVLKFDIMILICRRLRTLNKYRFKTFETCQNLLIEIANRCNPKEMLVSFLAELENGTCELEEDSGSEENETEESSPKKVSKSSFDNCVKSLFTPLKIVINKMPNRREVNLKWVLGILNCHLTKIAMPIVTDQQSPATLDYKEYNKLNQASLERFDFLLPDYLNFLAEFVDQYANENYRPISAKYLNGKITLIKALLSILHHPLMHLDLSTDRSAENSANKPADKPVNKSADKPADKPTDKSAEKSTDSKQPPPANSTANSKSIQSIDLDKEGLIIGLTSTKDKLLSELKGVKCFKQNSQIYSFQIVNLISRLEPNIFDLYDLEQLLCRQEKNEDSKLKLTEDLVRYSLGVQAYICYVLLGEHLNFIPSAVYSPIYVFAQHVQYIIMLMERSEPFIYEKGLYLAEKLIFKLPDLSVKSNFLDFLREHPLDKTIIKVMRFSANEQHRRTAYQVYRKLITILDAKGRYNFIYKTSAEPNQYTGIRGLMITVYKDFVLDKAHSHEFTGSNLQNFIRLVIDQHNLVQEEFDLIENMDSLMSFLNFIRFLLIWNKSSQANVTGVLDEPKEINEFLDKLKKKIEFGRSFLKMKINLANSGDKSQKKKDKLMLDIACANGGDNLTELFSKMSEKDEIAMYEKSLVNVDMMDSVLARVTELVTANCK